MAVQIQLRRGTTAEHSSFTGVLGEITMDTTKNVVVVHNGSLLGGFPLALASGSAITAASLLVNNNLNISSGNAYQINGTSVLNATTLGSGVTASSLTSVGTLSSLTVSGQISANGNIKLGTSGTQFIYGPSTSGRSFFSNSDGTAYIGAFGSAYGAGENAILKFVAGTTNSMTYDASGNLGLGVTPSAWGASYKAMQVGARGGFLADANGTYVTNNFYNNGTSSLYIATDAATLYYQASGQHQWYNAPSGTAGNAITFTQAMTLDASGNLGVGTDSPGVRLEVVGATGTVARFRTNDSTAANNAGGGFYGASSATAASRQAYLWLDADGANFAGADYFYILKTGSSGDTAIYNASSAALKFGTADTERARITSGGNVGVGTASVPNLLQLAAGGLGLQQSVIRSSPTSGDFTVSVGGLTTLTGSAWRQSAMLVFYSGLNGAQTADTNFLAFIKIQGLSTYGASVQANIVSTATITTANATSTGVDITFDVDDNNLGSVFVVLLGGHGGDQPTLSITA